MLIRFIDQNAGIEIRLNKSDEQLKYDEENKRRCPRKYCGKAIIKYSKRNIGYDVDKQKGRRILLANSKAEETENEELQKKGHKKAGKNIM